MGYYGWFRVYVKSTSPLEHDHIVKFVKYIIDNIDQLDPESQTAIYFDVEDGVLEADSFKLSQSNDEEEWFPKKLPGQLYKIEIELKYPSENDLKLLSEAAKKCYPESSFIAGTMDDNEYNLSQMGLTKEELIQFQIDNLWVNSKLHL